MDGLTGEWGGGHSLFSADPTANLFPIIAFSSGLHGGIEELVFIWILFAHTVAERRAVLDFWSEGM